MVIVGWRACSYSVLLFYVPMPFVTAEGTINWTAAVVQTERKISGLFTDSKIPQVTLRNIKDNLLLVRNRWGIKLTLTLSPIFDILTTGKDFVCASQSSKLLSGCPSASFTPWKQAQPIQSPPLLKAFNPGNIQLNLLCTLSNIITFFSVATRSAHATPCGIIIFW